MFIWTKSWKQKMYHLTHFHFHDKNTIFATPDTKIRVATYRQNLCYKVVLKDCETHGGGGLVWFVLPNIKPLKPLSI